MAQIQFTKHQQQAIFVRGGNVLVSAAAGSGKTAVLTERVAQLLTGENPIPADRLVIVTFTLAAAVEMKQRIEKKIADLVEEQPENELLQSQQTLLSKAKICTIHSLCNELIKDHFQVLGLPASYRLAEENELKILKNEVLEQVLEEYYAGQEPSFLELADYFSDKDDRKLTEILLSVYDFIRSYPFPLSCLERFLKLYQSGCPFIETIWGKTILSQAQEDLNRAGFYLRKALEEAAKDQLVLEKYRPMLESDLDTVKLVSRKLEEHDWDHAVTSLRSYAPKRIAVIRGYGDKEFLSEIQSLRKSGTEILKKLKEQYLIATDEEYLEDLSVLVPCLETLFLVEKTFYHRLEEEKLARNVLDFSDLEHYALKLLVKQELEDYHKTQIALELSEFYEEIMVDECQDINQVQNLIFWALSKGKEKAPVGSDLLLTESTDLFMVGDVKQSIYRFRNAMPSLFIRRKQLFPLYLPEEHSTDSCAKILLQQNFRSRTEVTDTVNEVFSRLMSEQLGEICYDHGEELVPAASYQPMSGCQTELHLLDVSSQIASEDESEHSDDKLGTEAKYIAGLIQKMIRDGYQVQDKNGNVRPCRYRDFCILLRAKKGKLDQYVEKMKEYEIQCYADASNGYFDSFEISVMLNLLRVIDNPLLDIPLFSVMLSPMFGFTSDEAAEIRLKSKKEPLYLGVQRLADEGNIKCSEFLAVLNYLREQAVVVSSDKLIQKIYDQTGFLFVVESMVSGEQKRANLRLLLSYAESYESAGYRGLSGFIRFIDKAIERDEDFNCANTVSEKADVVRVMSIHGSKGLEFPICILADYAKGFNLQDLRKNYLLHGEYGFGMNVRKPESFQEYSNLPFEAIKLISKREMLSEEMRTLYVAMTRAKEKLILVASQDKLEKTVQKIVSEMSSFGGANSFSLSRQKSYLEWTLSALWDCEDLFKLFADCYPKGFQGRKSSVQCILANCEEQESSQPEEPVFTAKPDSEILRKLEKSMRFHYPYEELSNLPAKVTATQMAKAKQGEIYGMLEPLTLSGNSEMTGAQRGTILHSFMQYADFRSATQNLEAEISRLVKENYLSETEAKALNRKKVAAFLDSPLLKRMMNCENLYREYAFLYEIDACQVDESISDDFREEKVLMQGIADTVFEEEDGMVIVDYKTDRIYHEDEFVQKYGNQLRIYKEALSRYFKKPIKECCIYSLYLEKEISVL